MGTLRSAVRNVGAALALALFLASISVPSAHADENVFQRSCDTYASPKEFVKRASIYCLAQDHNTHCLRAAQQYFEQCKYEGNYRTMSQRAHSDLLLLFVLAKTPNAAIKDVR